MGIKWPSSWMRYQHLLSTLLVRNILSNYFAVVWMGVISLAFIPIYFRELGSEQWGVVAICIALQALFNLLDVGLAQIMPRDVARVSADKRDAIKVYKVYAHSYIYLGLIGFLLAQLAIPWLIAHWFSDGKEFSFDDKLAFHLVMVQFLFQFANNANTGFWNGVQSQGIANFRLCFFGTLKHVFAVFLVLTWQPTAFAYLIPFVVIAAVEYSLNYRQIMLGFKGVDAPSVQYQDYLKLAKDTGIFFMGVLLGMLASQMDKIILTHYVSSSSFGVYAVVLSLGLAFMQLQAPLVRAFLPKIAGDDPSKEGRSFLHLAIGITIFCVLPCILFGLASSVVLQLWIDNPQVTQEGSFALRMIFFGVALNALYQLVYQKLLIQNKGAVIVRINFLILLITVPFLILTGTEIGISAGGLYWFLMCLLQLVFGVLWLKFSNKVNPR